MSPSLNNTQFTLLYASLQYARVHGIDAAGLYNQAATGSIDVEAVRRLAQAEGLDGAMCTLDNVRRAICPDLYQKPYRTFAEMLAALEQHQQGLVSTPELVAALQCCPQQWAAIVHLLSGPAGNDDLTEYDSWVDNRVQKGAQVVM